MARIIYKNANGESLPGVTTVISGNLGWSQNALMWWAWDQGTKGLNFRDTSQKACDIGSCAHAMVEHDLHGKVFDTAQYPKDVIEKAENAFMAWLDWCKLVDFKLVAAEISLIDEDMGYGGTLDQVLIKGKLALSDIKTSKAIYPDHWIQLSAYKNLWEKNYPDKPLLSGYYILQINKEDGSFSYHHKIDLSHHWEAFQHLLALNKLKKILK